MKRNLLTSSKALFVFARLNLSQEEIMAQSFDQADEKEFLEKAGEFALIYKHRLIETGDLIMSLFFFDHSFQKTLEAHGLDINDLQIIISWQNDFWKLLKHKNDLTDSKNLKLTGGVGKNWASGYTPFLDQVGRDLTLTVSGSSFDLHHYAHQKNIDEIERILSRTGNKNVILIGHDGVGKKTSVLGFSRRVLLGKTLSPLVHKKVIEIDLSTVLAGNDSGEKLIKAINEAVSAGNIILYFESIERLFDRENAVGAINAAPALLSAFRSNSIQIIATTTPASWTKIVNSDPGINEVFETIEINEPNQLEVIKILTDIAPRIESSANVIFSYQAIKSIYDAATRYLASESFPQKGIKLIDEIATEANRQKIRRIDENFVNQILSDKFSAPVGKVEGDEAEKLLQIEDLIHQRVVNQKKAISAIANALKRSRSGLSNPNKPIGSFLFLGPTGVGKTETAKALAEFYYNSEKNMLRFDMSEFQTVSSLAQIIGNPDTGEGGRLTNAVREKPYSLVLFDEIEKAHPNLLNLFLQILDEGFITDALNQKINFANTIIIGTSNAGANLIRQTINQQSTNLDMEELSKNLVEYLQDREIFRPEFINRFDSVVAFRPLNHEELIQVTDILIAKLNQNLQSKFINIKLTEEARKLVAQIGFDPKFGARALQRAIQDTVSNIVADAILKGQAQPHQEFTIQAQMIKEKMI
ncbi:MAG: clp protease ATP binding subunit [Berkelbacteria bacterium GW2011_GWA2_35_9]|uniref:Clp protease ATP binding subunit n=1 Tax=Berkelbacteria bacterium GW2011_GWA2_35_9 TaxID=1618333 RepID=A0A0G0DI49_9BACT|nr:MAG: clp protease ATP binding subunit [Berkelbacteria bacterium GW2011_GWA2_35_9]